MTSEAVSEPVVIVSNDTHVGPRLLEDLRPYCPSRLIDEFNRFAAMTAEQRKAAEQLLGGSGYLGHPNLRAPGHHDSSARLADYDHDGIAAGVLFHGSMNMEPVPFVPMTLGKAVEYEIGTSPRPASPFTTAGWPTSCRRRRTATSAWLTCP